MAYLAERLDQIVGGVAVILDHEQAHGGSIRLRFGIAAEGGVPIHIGKTGHRSHQFSSGFGPEPGPEMREGVADLARHPLNDPIPAGATVAGLEPCPERRAALSGYLSGRTR